MRPLVPYRPRSVLVQGVARTVSSSLRRGALAAAAIAFSIASLASCAAGNNAETHQINPDNARATVGDIMVQNAVVVTQPDLESTGPAIVAVGGVVVAPRASELIHPISIAVDNNLTVEQIANTFTVYPSLSGSIAEVARHLHTRKLSSDS